MSFRSYLSYLVALADILPEFLVLFFYFLYFFEIVVCEQFYHFQFDEGKNKQKEYLTFPPTIYVTGSEKKDHFTQEFIIELLVLKGRVALKQ